MTKVPLGPNEYQCDACGGVFLKGRPDGEAHAEADARFGKKQPMGIVCDACFKKMAERYGWEKE